MSQELDHIKSYTLDLYLIFPFLAKTYYVRLYYGTNEKRIISTWLLAPLSIKLY